MKYLIFSIAFSSTFVQASSQFETMPVKTRFTYKFEGQKLKANENGNGQVVAQRTYLFSFTIDTILKLKENRTLTVFTEPLSQFILNNIYSIIDVKNNGNKNYVDDISLADMATNNQINLKYRKICASALYQVKDYYFLLTIPKLFLGKYMADKNFVNELDSILSAHVIDEGDENYDIKGLFIFKGMYLPFKKFLIRKSGGTYTDENRLDCFGFYGQAKIKNKLCSDVDEYHDRDHGATLYISDKYGIVKSECLWVMRGDISYKNLLDLVKVEFP